MPSLADRQLLTQAFYEDCLWPTGEPLLKDAWLGIYQLLLWYAHGHIHIREANDLQKNKTWQRRATDAEAYIAAALNVEPAELAAHVDRMMQMPRWRDALAGKGTTMTCPHCGQDFLAPKENQRNNPLGNGLRILTAEVLQRWGDGRFIYEEEAAAATWFPGIQMPGRSTKPKVDVMVRTDRRVRVIISCKWSGRHDRMSDVTNECQQYKQAAIQQQNMDLRHFVITNELDGQRTDKILNQPCINGLVMVHLPLARAIGTMTSMMERNIEDRRLLDLTEFVELTRTWTGVTVADWLTPEQRTRNMASIRSSGTTPERRLGAALRVLYPRRRIVEGAKDLPGRPDYYLPGLKLAVFADGCFWHRCPTHGRAPGDNADYWGPKLARNAKRDRAAVRELRRQGIRSVRVWEHDLRVRTIEATMRRLARVAKKLTG